MRQFRDGLIFEVLAAGEDAAKQHGSVDRGDFGIPDSFASVDVSEVVKEAPMRGQFVPEKRKSLNDAAARFGTVHEAAFFADADGGQSKAGRGDTGGQAGVFCDHVAAILDQAGRRIRLFPKEEKVGAYQSIEKLIVFLR